MGIIASDNKEHLAYEQKENSVVVNDFKSGNIDGKGEGKYISTIGNESILLDDRERTQVIAGFIYEKGQITSLQIKKIQKKKIKGGIIYGEKANIFLKIDDITILTKFLEFLLNSDLKSLSKGRIDLGENISFDEDLIKKLSLLSKDEDGYKTLKEFLQNELTNEEVVGLGDRKKQLIEFQSLLEDVTKDEKNRQKFFETNSRIFGYGLDYKYLGILQREADVGTSDLSGGNSPITDFLMGCKDFTVLVELKAPKIDLFSNVQDRSNSWKLSNDLLYSISQILAQKADWQIKSQTPQFTKDGKEIKQQTIDPKTILIIGRSKDYSGEDQDQQIKKRTFELFRRNLKNIEILTYDELYERARFIVEGK
ncbi:MAG: Shedu immune nuclease family protein [Candidatus Absconditabacterales bacterium]